MKKLYSFTIEKTEEVEENVESVNESGAKVITINKVKKNVPHKFFLSRMTNQLRSKADLFYGCQYGEAIQNGMIPAALLQKRFENDDGILSEKNKDKINKLFVEYLELEAKFQKLQDSKEKTELEEKIKTIKKELRDFQSSQNSLYNNTPEIWARNRTAIWYMLFLSYKESPDGKEEPFFVGDDYKSKIEHYDKYEEENDEFHINVIREFLLCASLYYSTGISSQEEFEKMLTEIKNEPE